MIEVTRPFLPSLEEYQAYIGQIWERNWLTNNGPLEQALESQLKERLGVEHLLFLCNGTVALQIAIKALELSGEIITTPFSYVATTSSIVWENCVPVFVDIDRNTLNIDPTLIEAAITPETTAILATHVYGNPCDIDAIDVIAKKHDLKVIYDASHCFGTLYKDLSILNYGDISTISFHATKLFHTIEGGAVITTNKELNKAMFYHRNFGHAGFDKFDRVGINGKNSEVHAAMGLTNLKYCDAILEKRKTDHALYDEYLAETNLQKPTVVEHGTTNHSYYAVIFDSEEACVATFDYLQVHKVFARRYFYPVLSELNYVKHQVMPVAEDIAKRALCLPLYYQLDKEEILFVCEKVKESLVKLQGQKSQIL